MVRQLLPSTACCCLPPVLLAVKKLAVSTKLLRSAASLGLHQLRHGPRQPDQLRAHLPQPPLHLSVV